MNLLLKKSLLTACWALAFLAGWTQVKFSASISPARINKDEYTTLRLIVENASDIQRLDPPSLKDFLVVSGPNQETGMSSVNGAVTQYIALSYVLQPKRPGKINIGKAVVVIAGKQLTSNALSIDVVNALSGNAPNTALTNPFSGFDPFAADRSSAEFNDEILKKGENIADKVSRNMQLRLQTDKTSCYVGEPIVASYKLYTRLRSESKLSKNPSFNGFSVIDLQQADVTDYSREKLNGKEYNVYTIRKAQLYPLQPGKVEIESATLDNQVDFIKEEYSSADNYNNFFNGQPGDPGAQVSQSVSLSSKPQTIIVKPLPEQGKPASFTGAVGVFELDGRLEKNAFSTDESGSLVITISGSGNLQLLTAPDVKWPDGVEAFDPKLTDNIERRTVPVSGSKTFHYSFTADTAGSYTIPPIEFSYFDPRTSTYKTLKTSLLHFDVSIGTGNRAFAKYPVEKKPETPMLARITGNRPLVIGIVAGLLFFGLMFWIKRDRRTAPALVPEPVDEKIETVITTSTLNQQNPLEETEACLYREDCVEFYALLNKELKCWLANKFSLNVQDINAKNIIAVMDRSGIENETVLELQELLHKIEWQLYTPFEQGVNRQEVYSHAQELIQLINTYQLQTATR